MSVFLCCTLALNPHQSSAMASERAKKLGKKIIEYPEEQPSVPSSKDWVQNLVKEPKSFVR